MNDHAGLAASGGGADAFAVAGAVRLAPHAARHSAAQIPTAAATSHGLGEKIRTNPFPFTSAAKLDTHSGIMNSRTTGQNPSRTRAGPEYAVFTYSANPMITHNPKLVAQSRGLGSKYRTSTTRYQMK